MRILKNYNHQHKIKNSYIIIIMTYKSKKYKRYIKKQTRRNKRKMYGGDITQYNKPADLPEIVEVPPTTIPPTIKSNMKKIASIGLQYGNNVVEYYLNVLANAAGVDPNKTISEDINNISEKTKRIILALQTPQGQDLLKNTASLALITTQNVVAPAINELIEELMKNLDKIFQQTEQLALNALEEIPGPGTLIGLARVVDNLINIAEEGTDFAKKLLNTADGVTTELKTRQGEFSDLTNKFSDLVNNPPTYTPPTFNPPAFNPLITQKGGSLKIKKIHKEAKMIGGRINKSRLEFFNSSSVNKIK